MTRTARRGRVDGCAAAAHGRRPRQALRRADRLPRRLLRALAGRGRWRSSANPARARRRCSTASPAQLDAERGRVLLPHARRRGARASSSCREAERRALMRTDWGFVHQDPRDGLRMSVSAGANIGERLMAVGDAPLRPHSRQPRVDWLRTRRDRTRRASTICRRPIPAACASACRSPAISSPSRASCSWTSRPAASTSRCRRGCSICCAAWSPNWGSPAIIVTHDLAVARLLVAPHHGDEAGRGDRERPDRPACSTIRSAPYTQLLVSSVLAGMSEPPSTHARRRRPRPRASRCICRAARGCRWCAACRFAVEPGECVVLARPVGRRQVVDPEDDLRQLSPRRRPHPGCADGERVIDHRDAPRRGEILDAAPAHDRLCQPVPARHSARRRARHRRRPLRARRGSRATRRATRAADIAARGSTSPGAALARCRPRPSPAASSSASISRAASSARIRLLLLDEPTASLDAANRDGGGRS